MRKIIVVFLSLFSAFFLYADIDIGLKVRGRYYEVKNPLGTKISDGRNYYGQRSRFYLKGFLKKNVTAVFVLRSESIWGRKDEDEIFLDNAYIDIERISNYPVSLKLGRQSVKLGDGVFVNDDGKGLDGFSVNGSLPWSIELNLTGFKLVETSTKSSSGQSHDRNLYLASLKKELFDIQTQIAWIREFEVSSSTKAAFLDVRLETKEKQNIRWIFEGAKSISGSKKAFIIKALAKGNITYLKKGGGFLLFSSIDEGCKLSTSYTSETAGFGYFYIKNREQQRENTLENLQILGAGIDAEPLKRTNFSLHLFNYTLNQSLKGEDEIGREIDVGISHAYSENLFMRLVFSIFTPQTAYVESGKKIRQLFFETKLYF